RQVHVGAVVGHLDVVHQGGAGAAGADAREVVPERFDALAHAGLGIGLDVVEHVSFPGGLATSDYSSDGCGAGRRRDPASADQGADRFTAHDPHQVARHRHVVDAQRHAVITAQRNGGGIHHLQVALDHVVVGELLVTGGVGMARRVGGVHAIDL